MNAKKLVVAALSASMILTATPAFAKETKDAKETKVTYTAEQQYIISLLEQAVANDVTAVANAKVAVAEAEKAVKADPELNTAKINVEAKEFTLKVAETALADYEKTIDSDLVDLVKKYNDESNSLSKYMDEVTKAENDLKDAVSKQVTDQVKVPTSANVAAGKIQLTSENETAVGSDAMTALNGQDATVEAFDAALKGVALTGDQRTAADKVRAEIKAIEDAEGKNAALAKNVEDAKTALTKANEKVATSKKFLKEYSVEYKKALDLQWDKAHEKKYAELQKDVAEAKADVEKAKAEFAALAEKSVTGQKLAAAKEALKAAEAKLAADEKALAAAKAGESDKELVVDGTNGKKQVPNTADAE